ncbi:hypothetical protein [Helicobacter saguini]|nr:hypothetical protein [Helicobacter saguini]
MGGQGWDFESRADSKGEILFLESWELDSIFLESLNAFLESKL